MATIAIIDQINSYHTISQKKICDITFKDTLSLIFHVTTVLANNSINSTNSISPGLNDTHAENEISWMSFYQNFLEDLEHQNKQNWPTIFFFKKSYFKRIEAHSDKAFIKSKHFLMLLLRLLYVENLKEQYNTDTVNYQNILQHNLNLDDDMYVYQLSLQRLFEILQLYINHFMKIYNDKMIFEYQLGKSILTQLTTV